MLDVINKTISCVQIPYIVLIIVSVLLIILKDRKGVLFLAAILLMMAWRSFFRISSSRYCCSFLILILGITSYFYFRYRSKNFFFRITAVLVFLFLLSYNVICTYSSYRNLHLFYIQDISKSISAKDQNIYSVISEKEFSRVGYPIKNKLSYESSLTETLEQFSLWGYQLTVIALEKSFAASNSPTVQNNFRNWDIIRKSRLYTNRRKNSVITLYSFKPRPHRLISEYTPDRTGNLIKNGDIEIICTQKDKLARLKKWISQGADYYVPEDIIIPRFDVLLPTWMPFNPDNFPEVFADSESPIKGKYSLHVFLKKDNDHFVFFSNKFLSCTGKLTFAVQNLGDSGYISLSRLDYNSPSTVPAIPDYLYYIFLPDQKACWIESDINSDSFKGEQALFFISGTSISLLVDDIIYVPHQTIAPID